MDSENIIIIDGQSLPFTPGETILQVARRNDIQIPTICFLKGATPTGRCRICLVEIEGEKDLVQSCIFPATPGLSIRTDSRQVIQERRQNLELLMASGQHNCLSQDMAEDSWADFQLKATDPEEHHDTCPAYGVCRLQELAIQYEAKTDPSQQRRTPYPIENINPFIVRDFSRCILCGRCIKACNEIQVNNVIRFDSDDSATRVVTDGDRPLRDSDCVFCGECVQVCPVGALVPKQDVLGGRLQAEAKKVRTTCSYCGVGCQINLHVKDNRVIRVTGEEGIGPNFGSLCVKGRFGYDFINVPDRLKTPLIREDGRLQEASWGKALNLVAEKLALIKKGSGPDSIGIMCSARITNEENYLTQKFTRAVLGTNNIDHCARL
ncbi:MAG: (2Fe-2S)-binding protein [Proteobacteria bacterium]|nr:(2Fe-2S)-binding protein [Pseudomonadota bacterium]